MIDFRAFLENRLVSASAPCRVDMGGTLDLPTFFYPLRPHSPCTVNIALNLRTRVDLFPCRRGIVRVLSSGFEPAVYPLQSAPLSHPLGLVFAVARYFGLDGVEIRIESGSPVRSALGGSSVAVVALIGALGAVAKASGEPAFSRRQAALLAQGLESAVARVPCGIQDQLAAAFGGVNCWHWGASREPAGYCREPLFKAHDCRLLQRRLLVAYAGVPHESKDVNGQWVERFLAGRDRNRWIRIVDIVRHFSESLRSRDFEAAGRLMNRETRIRLEMTPHVLDDLGRRLHQAAERMGCGARFSGAGGGGCLWALGPVERIEELRGVWEKILAGRDAARLLEVGVDSHGLLCQLDPDNDAPIDRPPIGSTPNQNGQRNAT